MTASTGEPEAAQAPAAPPSRGRAAFEAWFTRFDPQAEHLDRLKMLSDGVFAIALTLLALEIRPPEHWDGDLATLLHSVRDSLISYALGFAVLGGAWMQQRRAFAVLAHVDGTATTLCLVLLATVGLIPAAVSFYIRYRAEASSFLIYGGGIAAMYAASALFWAYAAVIRPMTKPGLPLRYRAGQLAMQLLTSSRWSRR
jgi:uncharacterized membrane protein